MKALILMPAIVLAASPAYAISRYNSQSMSCRAVHRVIAEQGAVILRYRSARNPSLQLYDRYVADGGECAMGEGAIVDSVPTADSPQCVVYRCRDITYDYPDE